MSDFAGQLACVSLSPALDRYYWLDRLREGEINRPTKVVQLAGGKGLNAARAATRLDVPTRAFAVVGGDVGRMVVRQAREAGIALDTYVSDSETRQCHCHLDTATDRLTEVYEPARRLSAADVRGVTSLLTQWLSRLAPPDVSVLSGRLPGGYPASGLADLVRVAKARGIRVIVDAAGPGLAPAVEARPDFVKVNYAEAESVVGGRDALDLARGLRDLGADTAIVTDGAAGCVALGDSDPVTIETAPIPAALPVGSGDAFVAGMAYALLSSPTADLRSVVLHGAAAARVNARTLLAGSVSPAALAAELDVLAKSAPSERH